MQVRIKEAENRPSADARDLEGGLRSAVGDGSALETQLLSVREERSQVEQRVQEANFRQLWTDARDVLAAATRPPENPE